MPVLVVLVVALLLGLALTYYALHKLRPASLKLSASLLKLFSVTLEVRSPQRASKPPPNLGRMTGDDEPGQSGAGTGPVVR